MEQLTAALSYQKAESYSIVGNLLLAEGYTPTEQDILALNYLADEITLTTEQINEFLNDWEV